MRLSEFIATINQVAEDGAKGIDADPIVTIDGYGVGDISCRDGRFVNIALKPGW